MQQPPFSDFPDIQTFHHNARSFLVGSKDKDANSSLSPFEPSYGNAYCEAFPEYFDDTASHQTKVEELMQLLKSLNIALPPGSPVAVVGCGRGTHDTFLSQQYKLALAGIDICSESLTAAQEKAQRVHLPIQYYCADITQGIPLAPDSMKAAFSLGSSWGFDAETKRNQAAFASIAKILQPGGVFVLDYVNGQKWLTLEGTQSYATVHLANGATRTSEQIYDAESATQVTKFTLTWPDKPAKIFYHYTRYYTLERVLAFLQQVDLDIHEIYGDMQGHPFDPQESYQMVIIATKK